MPPKTKADAARMKSRKTKLKHPAGIPHGSKTDGPDTKRPKREVKPPQTQFDLAKDEEAAQLERAIQLSLAAQKSEKIKNRRKKADKPKDEEVNKRKKKTCKLDIPAKITKRKLVAGKVTSGQKTHITKKSEVHKSSDSSTKRSPSKKIKLEPDKDVKTREETPSTSSFIKYVLQKGASNRDQDLVKRFERPEPVMEESTTTTTNTATESESDWDPVTS